MADTTADVPVAEVPVAVEAPAAPVEADKPAEPVADAAGACACARGCAARCMACTRGAP
jgi:hypothetical protein